MNYHHFEENLRCKFAAGSIITVDVSDLFQHRFLEAILTKMTIIRMTGAAGIAAALLLQAGTAIAAYTPLDVSGSAIALSQSRVPLLLSISTVYEPYRPAFKDGESLRYTLSINGLTVGRCDMRINGDRAIGGDTRVWDVRATLRDRKSVV